MNFDKNKSGQIIPTTFVVYPAPVQAGLWQKTLVSGRFPGHPENSPAIHGWVQSHEGKKSPVRDDRKRPDYSVASEDDSPLPINPTSPADISFVETGEKNFERNGDQTTSIGKEPD